MNNFGITWPYVLRRGHSSDPSQGACALDAINWLAHGRHGDRPECACPVIGAYVIWINDAMPDDQRQRLLAFLPRIAGSRSPEHEAARVRVFVLAAARIFAADAMDAAGLHIAATNLRSLPDTASYEDIEAAAVRAARAAAAAAAAAWDSVLAVLDAALTAGPQGEAWSADVVAAGVGAYACADGLCVPVA